MKKIIITSLVVAIVSFLTAWGILSTIEDIIQSKVDEKFDKAVKQKGDLNKTFNTDTIIAIPKDSIIEELEEQSEVPEDEIVLFAIQVNHYINNNDLKSLTVLEYYKTRLKNYYKIKGLKNETNKLLKETIRQTNIVIQKYYYSQEKSISH